MKEMIIIWGFFALIGYIALKISIVRRFAGKYWHWIAMILIAYIVSKFIAGR